MNYWLAAALISTSCSSALDYDTVRALAEADFKKKAETIYIVLGDKMGDAPDPNNRMLAPAEFTRAKAVGEASRAEKWALATPAWQVSDDVIGKHQADGKDMVLFFEELAKKGLVKDDIEGQAPLVISMWTSVNRMIVTMHWVVVPTPALPVEWGKAPRGRRQVDVLRSPLCTVTWSVSEVTGLNQEDAAAQASLKLRSTITSVNADLLEVAQAHIELGYGEAVGRCTVPRDDSMSLHFQRGENGWHIATM